MKQYVNNDKPHAVCLLIFDVKEFDRSLSHVCIFSSKDSLSG